MKSPLHDLAVPQSLFEVAINVQITMAEPFGISGRGAFYDATGAIRDVMDPALDNSAPILYDPGSCGLEEAGDLVPDGWYEVGR